MPSRHVVGPLSAIPEGAGKAFSVAGRQIAVFNVSGKLYAIDDLCTHQGASLAEGALTGATVTCPWHGAEFDLGTGEALCPPAVESARTYPVSVNNGQVEVEL